MNRIPVIIGPTASGKTAYAISLAKERNGAIISADSRQVYAGLNIGTAKPQEAWKHTPHAIEEPDVVTGIPHYLLNIASLDTPYSLAQFVADAKQIIQIIYSTGKTPIIAGGTMLYIDALVDGYNIPDIKPNEELRQELESLSPATLSMQLIQKDPDAARFIESHNTRRIIRALEVMHATGKKFSELRTKKSSDMEFELIGIFDSYDVLRERITIRSKHMVAEGLEKEIAQIRTAYPTSKLLNTMNYKEDCDVAKMVQSNIRYAHRQMSWWKRRTDIGWICT